MTEKLKDMQTDATGIEPDPSPQDSAPVETALDNGNLHENSHAENEKRGRMITAGLVVTVTLAVVALLVAGIFQLTSKWLVVCPKDLSVNDPAPILWNYVLSEKTSSKTLGVPEKLLTETGFKIGEAK